MNKFRQIDKIFEKEYSIEPTRHFMSYGRLEIIGNHTDHQRGHCIVATCSQGIKGAVKERDDGIIHFYSEGVGERSPRTKSAFKKASSGVIFSSFVS